MAHTARNALEIQASNRNTEDKLKSILTTITQIREENQSIKNVLARQVEDYESSKRSYEEGFKIVTQTTLNSPGSSWRHRMACIRGLALSRRTVRPKV